MAYFRALTVTLACAVFAHAEISNLQFAGATPTQTIITYTAPDAKPCGVEVSESATFVPLVPDVDPSLFPGSDQDQRPGNPWSGQQRTMVIGKRSAEISTTGRRYSRALQAATPHFYRITCGNVQATGSFQTANIPIGKTYGEVLPADRAHPGQYAWPEMIWTSTNPRMIDPLTGLLYMPLTRPGSVEQRFADPNFVSTRQPNRRPEPPVTRAMTPARVVNAGNNMLYLRTGGFRIPGGTGWTEPGYSLDYFQVQWQASGGAVNVCLTIDSVSCASATRQVTLPASRSRMTVGNQSPNLSFWTDATHKLNRPDVVSRSGTVNVDASGTVTFISGDQFNPHWRGGSYFAIGKSECQVVNLSHSRLLHINPASCRPALQLPVSNARFTADNFGVLVQAESRVRYSIDSVAFQYGISTEPNWPSGAHTLFCADQMVADTSVPPQYGYHCNIQGPMYWINPITGEARFLGVPYLLNTMVGGDHVENCWTDAAAFDPTADKNVYVVLQGLYSGDHHNIGPTDPNGSQIQAAWTNLTPASKGRDLGTLIHAFDRSFDPVTFSSCIARGETSDAKLLITCQRGTQDSVGWEVLFDTATKSVIAAYQSWNKPPARWCALHSSAPVIASDRWIRIEFAGASIYQSRITSGVVAKSDVQACPPNPYGAAGNACVAVTVQGEPCGLSPMPGDPRNCPYDSSATFLQAAAPGDLLMLDREWTRLIAKNGTQWVLQRDLQSAGLADHAAGSSLQAACSTTLNADLTFWNFIADPHGANAGGNTVIVDSTYTAHSSVAVDSVQGSAFWKSCPAGANGSCLSVRTGADVSGWVAQPASSMPWTMPTFSGQTGAGRENFIESYSTFPPTSSQAPDRSWFLYNRPLTSDSGLTQLTPVSGELYQAATQRLHRKVLPTLATCGAHPLADVSGPKSSIRDDSTDAYRYCLALRGGECTDPDGARTTQAGAVYVNCPNVGVPLNSSCTGGAEDNGVCIVDNGTYAQSVVQVSNRFHRSNGQDARVLTNGFRPYRAGETFWNSRVLPDGSWALIYTQWFHLQRYEAFLAKLPPFPAPDGIDRSNFEQVSLYVKAAAGATRAVLEFGYAEQGAPDQYFCTSRQETCVRGTQSGMDFAYASEPVTPVDCESGCTIQVPAIPERVLYYRPKYLDAAGNIVLLGPMGAALVP